jgi:hypothetical protein
MLGLVAVGHPLQPLTLGGAQDYRAGSGNGQGRQADPEKRITMDRCLPAPDLRRVGRDDLAARSRG